MVCGIHLPEQQDFQSTYKLTAMSAKIMAMFVFVCDMIWYGMVWCGVVWCGVAWCGVVWRGVVWRGVTWRGVA